MLKKFFMIMLGVFIFLICPNVEAKEIDLNALVNNNQLPIVIEEYDVLNCSSIYMQGLSLLYIYVSVDNNRLNNFTYKVTNSSFDYTIKSYEEVSSEKVPKGKKANIVLYRVGKSSGYFFLGLDYTLVEDIEKKIVYNNTFGVENDNPLTYYEGETDILLKDISRDGYKFLGWYTSPTFEEETRITMISKDEPDVLNIYAKWEKIEDENIITNPNTSSMFYIAIGIGVILILGTTLVIVYKYKKLG